MADGSLIRGSQATRSIRKSFGRRMVARLSSGESGFGASVAGRMPSPDFAGLAVSLAWTEHHTRTATRTTKRTEAARFRRSGTVVGVGECIDLSPYPAAAKAKKNIPKAGRKTPARQAHGIRALLRTAA